MGVFKKSLFISVMVIFVFHAYFILNKLKFGRVKGIVAKDITKEADGFRGITFQNLEAISGVLSVGMGSVSCSHVLDFLGQFGLGSVISSSKGHLLEKIRGTSGREVLVS